MKRLRGLAIYPLMLGIYPVLLLYQKNLHIVPLEAIVSSLLVVIVATLTIQVLMTYVYESKKKGALIAGIMVIAFFSYGYIANLLTDIEIGSLIRISRFVISYYMFFVAVVGSMLLLKLGSLSPKIIKVTQLITIYLIALTMLNIVTKVNMTRKQDYEVLQRKVEVTTQELLKETTLQQGKPDIYYIVLDGRGRSETLKRLYDYDDKETLLNLQKLGFNIANESSANYMQTLLALPATLNMQYHEKFWEVLEDSSSNREPLGVLLNNNVVENYLKELGYEIYVINDGFGHLESKGFQSKNAEIQKEFERALLGKTPFWPLINRIIGKKLADTKLRAFEDTKEMSHKSTPTFTYTHVLSPHPPFILDSEGNYKTPKGGLTTTYPFVKNREDYPEGYREQVMFIDKKVTETVEYILKNSEEPPIIIVQSDHGPGYGLVWDNVEETDLKERFEITNWFYLPDLREDDEEIFPQDITPVNTFRYIFNKYFGTNLEILENRNYFAPWRQPYKFIEVTQELK